MSNPIGDPGHGHSTASWAAVVIMLVAIAVGTFAFFIGIEWLVWTSAALIVVGLIVGWALAKAGYGVNGAKSAPKEH